MGSYPTAFLSTRLIVLPWSVFLVKSLNNLKQLIQLCCSCQDWRGSSRMIFLLTTNISFKSISTLFSFSHFVWQGKLFTSKSQQQRPTELLPIAFTLVLARNGGWKDRKRLNDVFKHATYQAIISFHVFSEN